MNPKGRRPEYDSPLVHWYQDNYAAHKGFKPGVDLRVASGLAQTVLEEEAADPFEHAKRVSHLKGVLGEVLGIAALNFAAGSENLFRLIPSVMIYEPLGIDIRVMNGVPCPVMGFGVKLSKGHLMSVSKLPDHKKKIPILNIKVDPLLLNMDELILDQGQGYLLSPRDHVSRAFNDPKHFRPFKEMLAVKSSEALRYGVQHSFPLAASYLQQFI